MGHRHTPEEFGGACGVCSADRGFVAAVEERVMHSYEDTQPASPVSSAGNTETGGASPAPMQIEETELDSRSVPVRVALLALRFCKAYLSILFAGSCRFEPTCSRYAYEAIERFGEIGRASCRERV